MPPQTTHRFLVIGCGSIGRRHIANLLTLRAGEILACDTQAPRRREIESRFKLPTVASLQEGWAWNPDTVFVTTPTSSHLQVALAAAQRGCHLFIEKPLADRLEGADALVHEVRDRCLVSLIACNLRFHPGLQTVRALLDQNTIGRVCAARVEFGYYLPDWHPNEDYRLNYSARKDLGGGVLLDAIHEIDYVRWLLGEVNSVRACVDKISSLEIDAEDTAALILRFAAGPIAEIHLDYVQRAYRRTCQLIGEAGTILWDYAAGEVTCYRSADRSWTVEQKLEHWDPNSMYLAELQHFLDCLEGRSAPLLDVKGGRRVLEIALAAKKSSAEGRMILI